MSGLAWLDDAECRGVGHGPFFVDRPGQRMGDHAKVARTFCGRCPVLDECSALIHEQDPPDRWGIWAGVLHRGAQAGRKPIDLLALEYWKTKRKLDDEEGGDA